MDKTSILGVDSSLKKTGLCILDTDEKFIIFDRVFFKKPMEPTFLGLYKRVQEIRYWVGWFVDQYVPDIVSIEQSLPVGQMSAGLSAVTTALIQDFLCRYPFVYTFHPAYLSFLMGSKTHQQGDITTFAEHIIGVEGFRSAINKFSADEAVAFLHAYRLSILYGFIPTYDFDKFLVKKEVLIQPVSPEGVRLWQEVGSLQRQKGR